MDSKPATAVTKQPGRNQCQISKREALEALQATEVQEDLLTTSGRKNSVQNRTETTLLP